MIKKCAFFSKNNFNFLCGINDFINIINLIGYNDKFCRLLEVSVINWMVFFCCNLMFKKKQISPYQITPATLSVGCSGLPVLTGPVSGALRSRARRCGYFHLRT